MTLNRSHPLLRTVVNNDLPFVMATRRYVAELILACFQDRPEDQAYAERLATASAELLENAFKYSPPGTSLAVTLRKSGEQLQLEVSNSLREDGAIVLSQIRREIAAVWSEHDARDAFKKKVQLSLADPKSKAMLGYAKIRMETGGRLRARMGSHGRVTIALNFSLVPSASAFVDRPRAP